MDAPLGSDASDARADDSAAAVDGGPVGAVTMIGPAGGTATIAGASVVIPAGALSAMQPITLTMTTSPALTGIALASPIFRFEPHGLRFSLPVTVRIQFTGDPSTTGIFTAATSDGEPEPLVVTVAGDTLAATVAHFSWFYAGRDLRPAHCTRACNPLTACVAGVCVACTNDCATDCAPRGELRYPRVCRRFGNGCSVCDPECDRDHDGYCPGMLPAGGAPGGDCNDLDPNVGPRAREVCGNRVDDNCDGRIDEGCP